MQIDISFHLPKRAGLKKNIVFAPHFSPLIREYSAERRCWSEDIVRASNCVNKYLSWQTQAVLERRRTRRRLLTIPISTLSRSILRVYICVDRYIEDWYRRRGGIFTGVFSFFHSLLFLARWGRWIGALRGFLAVDVLLTWLLYFWQ